MKAKKLVQSSLDYENDNHGKPQVLPGSLELRGTTIQQTACTVK